MTSQALRDIVERAKLSLAEDLAEKERAAAALSILGSVGGAGEGEEDGEEKVDGEEAELLLSEVEALGGRIARRLKICLLKAQLNYAE